MTATSVLGIDLGKNNCSVVGLDSAGRLVLRRRVPRDGLAAFLATAELHRGDGSVLWCPLRRASGAGERAPGSADAA